jgi:hypothetical protein
MLVDVCPKSIQRLEAIDALAHLREEWMEAADCSLVDVETSVGLFLADVTRALGLSAEEQMQVLGSALYAEIQPALSE